MVRKTWFLILAILAIPVFLHAQAVEDKNAFLTRLMEKQNVFKEASGKLEINMNMMGSNMKIPVKFWTKDEKMRMDMEISMPGMAAPMEQVMLIDGKQMIQYQKMLNTVMTADLTKMPADVRKMVSENQTSIFGGRESIAAMKTMIDEIDIEEKSIDGRKFYVITVKDINKLGKISPAGLNTGNFFKKLLFRIDHATFLPAKIELYGDSETPGMWIDFLEFKTEKVSEEVFNPKFPEDAKQMDITEMVKNMFGGMKQP